MKYEELKDKHAGEVIHVLGASKMMDHIEGEFFKRRVCVGCNLVYKRFPVDYTITRHWKVVQGWISEVDRPSSVLLHPEYTNDLGGFFISEIGTYFDDQELTWTGSIIGTAIDLARYMGASQIVIWGVEHSNEYMSGYARMGEDHAKVFNRRAKKQFKDCVDLIRLKYGIEIIKM